jgi:NTP pyrophosphatase (non-canonical NTP hydrolase)
MSLEWLQDLTPEEYKKLTETPEAVNRVHLSVILEEIKSEVIKARAKHAPMRGRHEGYAVMLEEVDEVWEEIKKRECNWSELRKELVQVAAMAVCMINEVVDGRRDA